MAKKPEPGDEPSTARVRVLVNCAYGAPDDVVEIDSALIESLVGVVDADPSAVAYAETLKDE